MENFFTSISMADIVVVVVGAIMIWQKWETGGSSLKAQIIDDYETRLKQVTEDMHMREEKCAAQIAMMQNQILENTKAHDLQISDLTTQLGHLKGTNETLERLFTGRDPIQEQVFKQAPEIFTIARENNAVSKRNGEALLELSTLLKTFISGQQATKPPIP